MNEVVAMGWSHRLLAMFHIAVTKIPHRNYRGEGLTQGLQSTTAGKAWQLELPGP